VLFIAFGLLMALAWVRLGAPDVALAEAAIGAGLTGALLMAALVRLQNISIAAPESDGVQSHIHDVSNDEHKEGERKDD
jgi:energy-converting hydrogenase B subunit D